MSGEEELQYFWQPYYESWFPKFPEHAIVLPDIGGDAVLTEDQKVILAGAVETRKDVHMKMHVWVHLSNN